MVFGGDQQGEDGNNYNNNGEERSIKIAGHDFPMSHLIKTSLVFQERPKGYKSLYFAFFSVWPKGKDTYLQDQHITFMLELPKLRNLAKALRLAAGGALPQNNAFVNWADSSKAAVTGEDTEARSAKKFSIYSITDGSVSLTFNRGKLAGAQTQDAKTFNDVPIKLHRAEAAGLADYIEFLADEGLKLDFEFKSQAPLFVVRKKVAEIHEKRRKEREQSQQQGGTHNQGQSQSQSQGQTQTQGHNQNNTQQQGQQGQQQGQNNFPDQEKVMKAYPFLPPLKDINYIPFTDNRGKFLKAVGNVNANLKALADAGFQFTEGVPFWWRKAA